ncbi:MAG: hypothetical protein A4E27_01271 [Methanobacterium sp. PtaU1.Bin242]|nr:MAG: hypothetical protein A4E27_01271 [Methanobacterium sp. PtaU1.Bin242]
MVLGTYTGSLGSYAGFIIATIWVGYRVNEDIGNGALHGALVGFFAGIISAILMIILGIILNIGPSMDIMSFGLIGVIIGLIVDGIIGTAGGVIGSYLNM